MSDADRLPPAALEFLRDLAAHNDRAWFDCNRGRCEDRKSTRLNSSH